MAQVSSGSFTCSGGYKNRTLQLSWVVKSQSIENNTTTITWTLAGAGVTSGFSYVDGDRFLVQINGVTVYNLGAVSPRPDIYNGTVIASADYTLQHNNDGTCSFSAYAEGAIYYSRVNATGSGSWELPQIARQATITSAANFTDEGTPSISYVVPAPDLVVSLQACITDDTGTRAFAGYRDIPIADGTYNFSLTSTERANIRNWYNTTNSATMRYYIKTEIAGTTLYSSTAKTLTIVNANPTMSVSVTDSAYTSLTGNASTMIRGFNTMTATLAATAYKGATITSRRIVNGDTVYSGSSTKFTNTEVNTFTFTAQDSRGNIVTRTITAPVVNYVRVTCNLVVDSFNADGSGRLKFSGNFFNGSFGAKTNTLTVQYRYKTNSGSYGSWISASSSSTSGNTYSAYANLSGFDYRNSYTFQARAVDLIYTSGALSNEEKVKIVPLFDWGADSFSFNMPVENLSVNGTTLLDLLHPVGSVYISRKSTSPATLFGGTWARIKDRFILAAGDSYGVGAMGGAPTHTLSVSEMPSHNHYVPNIRITASDSGYAYAESWGGGSGNRSVYTDSAGGGAAHNNMPPYLALYAWERTG